MKVVNVLSIDNQSQFAFEAQGSKQGPLQSWTLGGGHNPELDFREPYLCFQERVS